LFLLQQSNFAMMFRVVSASNHTMGERLFEIVETIICECVVCYIVIHIVV
jgi:hypothetical protein